MGLIKTIDKAFSNHYTLRLNVYENAHNVQQNTSHVYVVGQLITGTYGNISSSADKDWSCSINGTSFSGKCKIGIAENQTKTLFTTSTVTVPHNADGSKTITVSGTVNVNVKLGGTNVSSVTASSNAVALANIPRNTKILTAPNVSVNGTNKSTVTIETPAVASYTHKVKWSIGSYTHTENMAAGETSASYAIPEAWKNAFPKAKSAKCTVALETYSGTTKIGTSDTKEILLSCTGSETPSFALTVSDGTGVYGKLGVYVVGKSKLTAKLTSVTYQFGASLKSVSITMDGTTYTGTSLTATQSSTLKTSGIQKVKAVLTDSRGYTKTVELQFDGKTYTDPSIKISIARYRQNDDGTYSKDDEGAFAKFYYSASYSEIGSNSISVQVDYAAVAGTDTGSLSMTGKTGQQYISCDTEKVYKFTIAYADKLTSKTVTKQLSTAMTIIDILMGGLGLAIGGVATLTRTLDIFWNTRIRGSLKVDNPVYINYAEAQYEVATGSSWVELAQMPELEQGIYHWEVVARFPKKQTGTRGLGMLFSEDGGQTKSDVGIGWTDVRDGSSERYTYCRISGNITSASRKLYLRAYQTSGETMNVDVRYSYHRIN